MCEEKKENNNPYIREQSTVDNMHLSQQLMLSYHNRYNIHIYIRSERASEQDRMREKIYANESVRWGEMFSII